MKIIERRKYGSAKVLHIAETEIPLVGDDQVLVKVQLVSLNAYDWHMMRGTPYLVRIMSGFFKPKFAGFGVDFAGEITAVGRNVSEFKIGDAIFGGADGALAEYFAISPQRIIHKSKGLTFEQAAAIPMAGMTALQGLRDKGRIGPGQKVLIIGASGGVGTFAVQIAKSLGAEVSAVCSTQNLELVRSLGADHLIDYTREDFAKSDKRYDVILQIAGDHKLSELRRVLNSNGIAVLIGDSAVPNRQVGFGIVIGLLKAQMLSRILGQKFLPMLAKRSREDLLLLSALIESGKVFPVIDRSYALGEIAAAITYLETGRAKGKVLIEIS